MTSTGTERANAVMAKEPAVVPVVMLAVVLMMGGGCSTSAPNVGSSRFPAVTGFAPEGGGAAGRSDLAPSRQPIEIDPDPQRDAQLDALVKAALDHLRSGEIQEALDTLTQAQTVEGWMHSEHAAAILFWTGHSYDQLGERFAAMSAFRRITIQYPRSAFADRASRRLRELRSRAPGND